MKDCLPGILNKFVGLCFNVHWLRDCRKISYDQIAFLTILRRDSFSPKCPGVSGSHNQSLTAERVTQNYLKPKTTLLKGNFLLSFTSKTIRICFCVTRSQRKWLPTFDNVIREWGRTQDRVGSSNECWNV